MRPWLKDKLTVSVRVSDIRLTADDWELYTTSMSCVDAAISLNAVFQSAVNSGLPPKGVAYEVENAMDRLAKFGAADSEPYRVLHDLMEAVYGENWWK